MQYKLNKAQSELLVTLERAIESSVAQVVRVERDIIAVGRALLEIRDSRLYRESHPSFEAYCSKRWNLELSRAKNYIAVAIATPVLTCDIEYDYPEFESEPKKALPVRRAKRIAGLGDKGKRAATLVSDEAITRPEVRSALGSIADFVGILKIIAELGRKITTLAAEPGGAHLEVHVADGLLRKLRTHVHGAQPHVACLECAKLDSWQSCPSCGGRGWLTKSEKNSRGDDR